MGIALLLLLAPVVAGSETIQLEASRDATLIEDPEGGLANGAGPVFFVGRTNQRQDSARRGLLHFDIAAALPRHAQVRSVRLSLTMTPSNSGPSPIRLHRLLADWGEGDSFASGGGGDRSGPGDATWVHTFFEERFWVRPGGHFVARASASRSVAGSGPYHWESTRKLVADVRLWLAAPHRNFGWILIGDETSPQSVKSFASREATDPAWRPVLEVEYRPTGR